MVRGCHICEADAETSDSGTIDDHDRRDPRPGPTHRPRRLDRVLRDVPIVDTDPSEDGWGIDDDLGASVEADEASAKTVIEAVARGHHELRQALPRRAPAGP